MVPRTIIFLVLGAVSIAFHLGLIFSGLVPNLVARPIHMALALPWIFLFATAGRSLWSAALFAGAGIVGCIYIVLREAALSDQYGSLEGGGQVALAAVLLIVVLEMARRAIGWPLPMVAVKVCFAAAVARLVCETVGQQQTLDLDTAASKIH